jgi:hypothetical protein
MELTESKNGKSLEIKVDRILRGTPFESRYEG